MSEQSSEGGQTGERDGSLSVSDDELPEDLRPEEDNPLAQPADDDVPDDILMDTAGGSDGDSGDAAQGGGDAPDASAGEASSEAESEDPDESDDPDHSVDDPA
jgi:hypothetical protein